MKITPSAQYVQNVLLPFPYFTTPMSYSVALYSHRDSMNYFTCGFILSVDSVKSDLSIIMVSVPLPSTFINHLQRASISLYLNGFHQKK